MLNRVILQGRLTADPELRHTPNGVAVATFCLAVDRDFKSKSEGAQTADFINIVVWRNSAEFVSKYFTKGQMALVEGRLQIRSYNDRDGNRRTAAEVVADSINFCGSKRDNNGGSDYAGSSYGGGYSAPAPAPTAYAPTAASAAPSGGFAELNEDDGELPF